jgi:hypothetical protein
MLLLADEKAIQTYEQTSLLIEYMGLDCDDTDKRIWHTLLIFYFGFD